MFGFRHINEVKIVEMPAISVFEC